jgi:hypothetical protein
MSLSTQTGYKLYDYPIYGEYFRQSLSILVIRCSFLLFFPGIAGFLFSVDQNLLAKTLLPSLPYAEAVSLTFDIEPLKLYS